MDAGVLAEQLASLPGSPNEEEVRNTPGDRCDGEPQSGRQTQQRKKPRSAERGREGETGSMEDRTRRGRMRVGTKLQVHHA